MGKKFECKLSHQALDYYYNKRHLTIKEMCEIVGCKSDITMAKILKSYGFDTDSNKKRAFSKRGNRTDEEFKEFLIEEYVNKKRSMTSIAKELNISWVIVSRYLDKYEIYKRTKSEQQRGERSVGWNGGKHKTSAGYIEIYMPDHPRANKRGCIYEHDYVAEMGIIHRRLKDNEIVHHINRKKDDNRMCNLMVLTREEHTKLHHAEMHEARMRESREVIGG